MEKTKVCTKCGEEKPAMTEYFYNCKMKNGKYLLRSICKECDKDNRKKHYYKNKEKESEYTKQYRKTEQGIKSNRRSVERYSKTEQGKEIRRKAVEKYNNSEKGRIVSRKSEKKYKGFKYATDISYRLNIILSVGIRNSLNGNKKGNHWEELVGYTVNQLKEHLEKQFQPGMTWENYGEWHIDHKRPKISYVFASPEDDEFKQCWSLDNLQPLWAEDNIRKSSWWNGIKHETKALA